MKNYTINVNGNVYEVSVEENTAGVVAGQAESTHVAQTQNAPVVSKAAAPAAPPKPAKPAIPSETSGIRVNAPMPGKILDIKANVGDVVKRGQAILILEAMKMENEIVAPNDGTIVSIDTSVGANVEVGDVLATLN